MFERAEPASDAGRGPALDLLESHRIAVWLTDGVPVRLVWRGIRYRVSDTPTVLTDRVEHPLITHPLERRIGWRFQATAPDGSALVFDIGDGRATDPTATDRWTLLRVWD